MLQFLELDPLIRNVSFIDAHSIIICSIFSEMVHNALDSFELVETENTSVFERIVSAKDVDTRDKIVTLIDLVAAGIETVIKISLNSNFCLETKVK